MDYLATIFGAGVDLRGNLSGGMRLTKVDTDGGGFVKRRSATTLRQSLNGTMGDAIRNLVDLTVIMAEDHLQSRTDPSRPSLHGLAALRRFSEYEHQGLLRSRVLSGIYD